MKMKSTINEKALERIMKSDMSAKLIDGLRDAPNLFEEGEHIVLTGSATSHYMWYKGLQDNYIYKPPSDIDLVLATPADKERSLDNVYKYRDAMVQCIDHAITQIGEQPRFGLIAEYDGKKYVNKAYNQEEIRAVLEQPLIQGLLTQSGIDTDNITLPESVSVRTEIDFLILDNSMVNAVGFSNTDNQESDALLRRESPTASVAFKIARAMLADYDSVYQRPADTVDVYNAMLSPGYDNDPALLRIMTIASLARLVPAHFDFEYAPLLSQDDESATTLQRNLRAVYNTHFNRDHALSVLNSWNETTLDIFPDRDEKGAPKLSQEEEDFIFNFLLPQSGNPALNINTELLKSDEDALEAFRSYPELESLLKSSSFSLQRIAFKQIAPDSIPL